MRHNAAFPQGLSIHQKRTSLALRHTQPTSEAILIGGR